MNAKELLEWLEERGELYICKADGGSYTVVARAADGVLKGNGNVQAGGDVWKDKQ